MGISMGTRCGVYMMLYVMAAIVGAFCVGVLLLRAAMWMCGFYREWCYVCGEIERAEEDERAYWLARRRRLWLSLLPFTVYRI